MLKDAENDPMEEEADKAIGQMGSDLYRLERRTAAQAKHYAGQMREGMARQEEDEKLQQAGKPPPLRRVR
jgi:hypothetical protein